MKVRAKQAIISSYGTFNVGDIIELPDTVAIAWIEAGIAEKVSDLPGPKERKRGKKDTSTND